MNASEIKYENARYYTSPYKINLISNWTYFLKEQYSPMPSRNIVLL